MAVNCWVPAVTRLTATGATAMDAMDLVMADDTVIDTLADLPFADAVSVVDPAATVVTTPVFAPTVATPSALEVQVAVVVMSCVEASE